MELRQAKHEELEANNDAADAKAIGEVAVDEAKAATARAEKSLKGKDLDAALAVAHDEEARESKDAKQIADVADKEKMNAAETKREATRVQHDATEIETLFIPAKNTTKNTTKVPVVPASK